MNEAHKQPLKIVAPVNTAAEVTAVVQAGADAVYCGVLPLHWAAAYGDWDTVSRRQGSVANVASFAQMEAVAMEAARLGVPASLTLNVRYTSRQLPMVLDIAASWERAGGESVLASDLSLLLSLARRKSGLRRHISILAAAFNSRTVQFFERLGGTRVVLPRSMAVAEMRDITSRCPGIEFEAMAINEKCEFIDGFCGFYHGTAFPDTAATFFAYETDPCTGQSSAYAYDLGYAGHACEIPFRTVSGRIVRHPYRNDVECPHCAACALPDLAAAGVGFLKVGGRGFPTHVKTRAVSFLRSALDEMLTRPTHTAFAEQMLQRYRDVFGRACTPDRCYYPPASSGKP